MLFVSFLSNFYVWYVSVSEFPLTGATTKSIQTTCNYSPSWRVEMSGSDVKDDSSLRNPYSEVLKAIAIWIPPRPTSGPSEEYSSAAAVTERFLLKFFENI